MSERGMRRVKNVCATIRDRSTGRITVIRSSSGEMPDLMTSVAIVNDRANYSYRAILVFIFETEQGVNVLTFEPRTVVLTGYWECSQLRVGEYIMYFATGQASQM